MSNRLRAVFPKVVEQAYNNRGKTGTVGKRETDGTITIYVENRPGRIYVQPDEGGTAIECLNGGFTPIAGLPVRIVGTHDNDMEAIRNGIATETHLGEGAGHTGMVIPHTHEFGGGLDDYVSSRRVLHGSVRATAPASMSVIIDAFDYRYGGSDYRVARTTFDLSSYTPATAATWQWVKVGYNPAAQAFVAVEGAEQSVLTPLNEDALPAISMAGYIPLGAVRIREDDTSIPEVDANGVVRFADIRQFLSGSDVLGLTDGDARYVQLSLFDANTFLAANTDNTPAAVTVAEQRILGRKTGGNIAALTAAEVVTLLGIVVFDNGVVCHNDEVVILGA